MAAEWNYRPTISLAEYLDYERQSPLKHEFVDGLTYMMAGASKSHVYITGDVFGILWSQLRGRSCRPYNNDMRIKTPSGLLAYPDMTVVCGQPEFMDDRGDVLLNPTLIVEVLSPSTELYDRTTKFIHYRSLPSLQTYVIIAQDRPLVEVYERGAAQDWPMRYEIERTKTLELPSIGCSLPLAEVYANVTFGDAAGG